MNFPLATSGGLIIVPARVTGPEGDAVIRLALDTGATVSMVNWEVLVLVGYDPASSPERLRVTTGSGVEKVPRMDVKSLEALGQRRDDFALLCHTLPASATVDGVLGLDFFANLRLVLDFRASVMSVD
jgi:hypothetical protein